MYVTGRPKRQPACLMLPEYSLLPKNKALSVKDTVISKTSSGMLGMFNAPPVEGRSVTQET